LNWWATRTTVGEDAVRAAVKEAARTLRGINGVEVMNWTGQVNAQGEITGYRANVHVAFKVGIDENGLAYPSRFFGYTSLS